MSKEEVEGKFANEGDMDEFVGALDAKPWHWFCKLGIDYDCNASQAEKMVRDWLTKISKEENLQITYLGLQDYSTSDKDVHLIVFGANNCGKTLLEVNPEEVKINWVSVTGQPITVQTVDEMRMYMEYLRRCSLHPSPKKMNNNMMLH